MKDINEIKDNGSHSLYYNITDKNLLFILE